MNWLSKLRGKPKVSKSVREQLEQELQELFPGIVVEWVRGRQPLLNVPEDVWQVYTVSINALMAGFGFNTFQDITEEGQ